MGIKLQRRSIYKMVKTEQLYASLKRYVFRRHLKLQTFETFLRAFGRLFHSFGAVTVKERSTSVALLFTFECSSRFIW